MKENICSGRILRAVSGFYWVQTQKELICCKPRGIFRKQQNSPVVGDTVKCSVDSSGGTITEIYERKNYFVRPPLANLDRLFFVVSTCSPAPNFFLLDQLLAIAEYKRIDPVLLVTKCDLAPCESIVECYRKAGFTVFTTDNMSDLDTQKFLGLLDGKISALCGNSGVGKSTFLNKLFPELALKTGETSEKLGRGRHTTRTVELYPVAGGYIADTPGFSTVMIERYGDIPKEDLQECFREFYPYLGKCKFSGCSHMAEPGCAVKKALENGEIGKSRYQSYLRMAEEANRRKVRG